MKKIILILCLLILAVAVDGYAKKPSPMQDVLKRLDAIEKRLKEIEGKPAVPKSTPKKETKKPAEPAGEKSGQTEPATKAGSATESAPDKEYKAGIVFDVKPQTAHRPDPVPPDSSLGGFIWDGEKPITPQKIAAENVKLSEAVGYEMSGYLKIKKAGTYNIRVVMKSKLLTGSYIKGWLEGVEFLNFRKNLAEDHVGAGSLELKKGTYKLRLWAGIFSGAPTEMMVNLKLPGKLNFSTLTDYVFYGAK